MAQYRLKNKAKIAATQAAGDARRRALNPNKYRQKWRDWAAKNKERLSRYRRDNREHREALIRQWRGKNLGRYKSLVARWYQENKERMRHIRKKWVARNKDRCRKYSANWRRRHPTAWRKNDAKRRARKLGCGVIGLEQIQKWERSWRSKRKAICYWCRHWFSPKECHTDHIVALANGGKHSVENLCISCASCNQTKSCKDIARWNTELSQPVLLI